MIPTMHLRWNVRFMLVVPLLLAAVGSRAQTVPEYELPPTRYSESAPSNRIERLQQKLVSGELSFAAMGDRAILRRCLEALEVPPDSQVLVFSKTSLQRHRIHPRHPRAIYFSDDCYVGWVPGGLFEIAVTDPHLGLVFYRFDPRATSPARRFERDPECLSCHAGARTRHWPGLLVRSVFPDEDGEPISQAGSFDTDHTSPLSERWGGWYVTGRHGAARHMGNSVTRTVGSEFVLDRESAANARTLGQWVSTDNYLRPDSDIVALMVLEHQVTVHTRLAKGALRVRRWMHYQQELRKVLGEAPTDEPTGTALRVVNDETRQILDALLFVDEAPLPEGGIAGNADFQDAFRKNRRSDAQGRSLKDFDLTTRLFRYRCSYLIHSEAFASLPAALKASVYQELRRGLSAENPNAPFDHLEPDERQVIRGILDATLPEWSKQP